MIEHDSVIADFKAKIERCENIIERTRAIWDKPFEALGAFATGRSNRPTSLDRAVDAENNRRTRAFAQYQKANADLALWETRLTLYQAGEIHADGRPKADSPSRRKQESVMEVYGGYLRATVKPGDALALVSNPHNAITVKRVNAKSITSASGSKWTFDEVMPMVDGEAMNAVQLKAAIKAFVDSNPPQK